LEKEKMKNKILTIATAIFLTLTMTISLIILPPAYALTPPREIPTYAYLSAAPSPIGIGQRLFIVMWLDAVLPGAAVENEIRFHNFKLTITKPDGTTDVQQFDIITDTASSKPYLYYPDKAGNYTFKFEFPGQKYIWNQANTQGFQRPTQLTKMTPTLPAAAN